MQVHSHVADDKCMCCGGRSASHSCTLPCAMINPVARVMACCISDSNMHCNHPHVALKLLKSVPPAGDAPAQPHEEPTEAPATPTGQPTAAPLLLLQVCFAFVIAFLQLPQSVAEPWWSCRERPC